MGTDDEFLDYCVTHAQTPRHLFHIADCRRLLRMAGETDIELQHEDPNTFLGMDTPFVEPLVKRARWWMAWREINPKVCTMVEAWCHLDANASRIKTIDVPIDFCVG